MSRLTCYRLCRLGRYVCALLYCTAIGAVLVAEWVLWGGLIFVACVAVPMSTLFGLEADKLKQQIEGEHYAP